MFLATSKGLACRSVDAVGLPLGVVFFEFGELVLEEGVVVVVDGWVLLGLKGLKEGEGFRVALRHFQG
jgi:hypothetical protein